ncbi:MAG: adenylosuccinate lyase, partial [Planctomycetota bacterium]
RVAELEADSRHDVMAHIHHFGEVAPDARGILHLGATSCFVTDNADLVLFREACRLLGDRLASVIKALAGLARQHRDLSCLAYTHFQPAQPTTVGKRVCMWIADFVVDLEELTRLEKELPFRGAKGATGTQASFLSLFEGDHEKVKELDRRVAQKLGFERLLPVTGQTYSRKIDHWILSVLSGTAQSASKFGVDVRLLCHEGELSEPFAEMQIGSSAMAYKRNPMRSERICSLARLVQSIAATGGQTHATQWLERSLDDSACRRIALPEAFLAVDACLILVANVAAGMKVHPRMIQRHLDEHLPFLATEELLLEGVREGGDRQDLHERIRELAMEAGRRMREEGIPNPLPAMLDEDPVFAFARGKLDKILDPRRFVGCAVEQVDQFLAEVVDPILEGRDIAAVDEVRV